MILAKWGGSLLTNKGGRGPPRFRRRIAQRLAKELAEGRRAAGQPVVLVHGAGSFGHPLAVAYGVGGRTFSATQAVEAYSRIHANVVHLQDRLLAVLEAAGERPEALPASAILAAGTGGRILNPAPVRNALRRGRLPVTGGDVVPDRRRGLRVLSGDEILYDLARSLRPTRVVYATDVDGVRVDGSLYYLVPPDATARMMRSVGRGSDATGGMRGKLEWAAKIQAAGFKAGLVNGARVGVFRAAVAGEDVLGTWLVPQGRFGHA